MRTCARLFLLTLSILTLRGGDPSARPSLAPRAPCPSAQQAGTGFSRGISPTRTARLFADGSVSCTGADDTSHPVGSVALSPRAGGTAFRVQLSLGAAMADWPYLVELSLGGSCQSALRFPFALDPDGNGVFTGFYPASSGLQTVLVDVVSAAIVPPPDPRLREIAPSGLVHVVVPDDGTTLLTLGFDGASGPLPWSEQGFTFDGDGSVSGQGLSMVWFGYPDPRVTLTRSSGGTFDAVALSIDLLDLTDSMSGMAWVSSDLGGYQELWTGSNVLQGPEWEGITTLSIAVVGLGAGAVWLEADDFMVRLWGPRTLRGGRAPAGPGSGVGRPGEPGLRVLTRAARCPREGPSTRSGTPACLGLGGAPAGEPR